MKYEYLYRGVLFSRYECDVCGERSDPMFVMSGDEPFEEYERIKEQNATKTRGWGWSSPDVGEDLLCPSCSDDRAERLNSLPPEVHSRLRFLDETAREMEREFCDWKW